MQYLSNRKFQIWGYHVSHGFLLLRSCWHFLEEELGELGYSLDLTYNIDIEFVGVDYLDMPTNLKGITIHKLVTNLPKKFMEYPIPLGCKIFEIISCKKSYYIIASSCLVAKNRWILDESRLNNNTEYDEILMILK